MAARYELYKDHADEWRWRYKAANGEEIAKSSEGYKHKGDCEHGIALVKNSQNDPLVEK